VTTVVPAAIPVSIPVDASIVANDEGAVLQLPPVVGGLLRVISEPAHTAAGPPIAAGDGLTVMLAVV
jgi:hypothetical protein